MKASGTVISVVVVAGLLVVGPHLLAEAKIPPFGLDVEVDETTAVIEVTFDEDGFDPPRLPNLVAIFPESAMDRTGRPADQTSRIDLSLTRTAPASFIGSVDLEPGRWVAVPFPEMTAFPKFAEPLSAYPEPVAFQTSTSRSVLPLMVGTLGVVGVGAAAIVLGRAGWKPALAAVVAVATTAAGVTALAGEGEAPFECPVTIPSQPGLSPPEPYPAEYPGDGLVWYGTEDLWTVLPVDGEYRPRKSVWWSVNFPGGAEEEQPDVRVTWTRLDNVQPVVIDNEGRATNAHTASEGWFMIAGIDPYSDHGEVDPGCWEVTASYKGASLTYVYEGPTVG